MGLPTDEKVSRYVQRLLQRWLAAEPGRTARAFALRVGVTETHVSDVRSGKRSPMRKLVQFGKALGTTAEAIYEGAALWTDESQEPPEPRSRTPDLEPDADYPSRAAVVRCARELGLHPRAIAAVGEMRLQFEGDPGPRFWLARLVGADSEIAQFGRVVTAPVPPDLDSRMRPPIADE